MGTLNVNVVGNLAADPELRYTPAGDAVCNLRLIVNHPVKNHQTNEWEEGEPSAVNVTVWRYQAQNAAETLQKGMEVTVTGKGRMRNFERRDGTQGTALEVRADEIGPSLRYLAGQLQKSNSNGGGGPQGGGFNNGGNQGGNNWNNNGGNNGGNNWNNTGNTGGFGGGNQGRNTGGFGGNGGNDEPPF